jgi:hypothetical protein
MRVPVKRPGPIFPNQGRLPVSPWQPDQQRKELSMKQTKKVGVVDNRVEYHIETHNVYTKKAQAYVADLAKNPVKRQAFLKKAGFIDSDGNLASEYRDGGTLSHSY